MPEIYINQDINYSIGKIFNSLPDTEKIAIIRGNKSFPADVFSHSINLDKRNRSFIEIQAPWTNPKFPEIINGLEILWDFKPDLIIGCGGGSVMDAAKILRYFSSARCEHDQLERILQGECTSFAGDSNVKLLLMPTTAGSGAQATSFSVVYFGSTKYSFPTSSLLPDFVIAGPELIRNAPPNVLASSAMDAIAQSIESIWARNATMQSKKFAFKALSMMWHSAEAAILHNNLQAQENIVLGSDLAGQAINISKTTGNHALSYKITTEYDIPHGHCVGMLLPQFFCLHRRIAETDVTRGASINRVQNQIASSLGYSSFDEFFKNYYRLMANLNLDSFEIIKNKNTLDIKAIIESVNLERLKNHPVDLSVSELESLFNVEN